MVGQQKSPAGTKQYSDWEVGEDLGGIDTKTSQSFNRKCLCPWNFNYPGHSFTPTLTGFGWSSPAWERSQRNNVVRNCPLPWCLPNRNDCFLDLTFSFIPAKNVDPFWKQWGHNIHKYLPTSSRIGLCPHLCTMLINWFSPLWLLLFLPYLCHPKDFSRPKHRSGKIPVSSGAARRWKAGHQWFLGRRLQISFFQWTHQLEEWENRTYWQVQLNQSNFPLFTFLIPVQYPN